MCCFFLFIFRTRTITISIDFLVKESQPLMVACGSGLSHSRAAPASRQLPDQQRRGAGRRVLAQMVHSHRLWLSAFWREPFQCRRLSGDQPPLFTMAAAEMGRFYKSQSGPASSDYIWIIRAVLKCLFSGVDCMMHAFGIEDILEETSAIIDDRQKRRRLPSKVSISAQAFID